MSSDPTSSQPLLGAQQPYGASRYGTSSTTPFNPADTNSSIFPPIANDSNQFNYTLMNDNIPSTRIATANTAQLYQSDGAIHSEGDTINDPSSVVRINALRNVQTIRFSYMAIVISILFNLPQIIAIGTVLVFNNNYGNGNECSNHPLSLWLSLYAARLSFSLLLNLVPLFDTSVALTMDGTYNTCNSILNISALIIFVLGNIWIIDPSSSNCNTTVPAVYQLCIAMLVINYVIMFLPCILLVILSPCVFLCLPVLLSFSSIFSTERGLDDKYFDLLPSEKYKHNMSISECSICLEQFDSIQDVRVLPCNQSHIFVCTW